MVEAKAQKETLPEPFISLFQETQKQRDSFLAEARQKVDLGKYCFIDSISDKEFDQAFKNLKRARKEVAYLEQAPLRWGVRVLEREVALSNWLSSLRNFPSRLIQKS